MLKLLILKFLIFLLIIKESFQQPLFGDCGKVGYTAKNFDNCKSKKPYDDTKYCCYLEAGKYQECVEILKEDIDNNEIKFTIKEIEKGIYEDWMDNNGYDLNRNYININSLECDKSTFLKLNLFSFLFFPIFYIIQVL